jgi:hypothetical protein
MNFILLLALFVAPPEAPMRPMVPYVEKAKVSGPKVEPLDGLKAWLAGVGEAVIRVPLTVVSGGVPGVARVVKLGALEVRVDDMALGVSFDERVRQACANQRPCRVWVEGRWSEGTLRVIHFARAVKEGEAADFVEREK